jgi:protein gp37
MKDTKIEWCDATFNPWHGCFKVSPGCTHCYAETLSKRLGRDIWGPPQTTARLGMSENYWKQPLRWNKTAEEIGKPARVFCASMADVFEDHPQIMDSRIRLFNLIDQTPWLDWLLLTKRPENVLEMMADWLAHFPQNIWIGTSVENQEYANKRIPELLKVPARVRFLSCEPLLGPVDIRKWLKFGEFTPYGQRPIHWIIAGGESGHGARPMHPDWARSLRDQCQAAGVAFFFKQWGEFLPSIAHATDAQVIDGRIEYSLTRVGKHIAGRLLEGRTWDEFPL